MQSSLGAARAGGRRAPLATRSQQRGGVADAGTAAASGTFDLNDCKGVIGNKYIELKDEKTAATAISTGEQIINPVILKNRSKVRLAKFRIPSR